MSTNILSQCIYGCGACILSDKSRINDNNGVCRYARNKQKKHNYQAIEYSVAVSKIRASHKHNSMRKRDGSRRPTVGSNHIQVLRTSEGVVPYATAVGRFPRNDNVEHYAHQERYALNQKKLRDNEAKQATKAMRNESNKVKQNNEHYAADNDQNDEDISTVYCGSLNGDRSGRQLPNIWSISKTGSGRQLPISGRSRRPRSARPSYDEQCALIEKLTKELVEEKQANIAKSDEFNQVNQRHVQISNELNRVKQINAQMRQDNQAMLAELNLVKKSYAHLQHQLSNILSNHPRSG
eukprot:533569_1